MQAEWFKDKLRELRERSGLSRQQLADKAGLKLNGIRDLEQGVNKPSWETVVALCKALNVGCDVFLQPPAPDLAPAAPGRPRKAASEAEGQPVGEAAHDSAEIKPGRIRQIGTSADLSEVAPNAAETTPKRRRKGKGKAS